MSWEFIFLNTKKNGIHEGFLAEAEIEFLKKSITSSDNKKSIAVVMHHHPVEVGTPFIDKYMLINSEVFWNLVERKIKLVISGHVHGNYSICHRNISLETAPATCVQWIKKCLRREAEKKIGYKVYYFKEKDYEASAMVWENHKNAS